MQTVWNRVAQTRAAYPGQSQAIKTCVTRQTATAAGKRPTKFLTSATLLYSGIFAVAATTDALLKEKRRNQWDEAIATARQSLETVDGRAQRHGGVREGEHKALDDLLSLADAQLEDTELDDETVWPENTGRSFDVSIYPPQSIYASSQWKRNHRERQLTAKKTQLTELAMDKMTIRIIGHLGPQCRRDLVQDDFPDTFWQLLGKSQSELEGLLVWINGNIMATKSFDPKATPEELAPYRGMLSNYSRKVSHETIFNTSRVEANVSHALGRFQEGVVSKTQFILEMLHNITSSPTVPSLQTFNKVLSGFTSTAVDPTVTEYVIRALRLCHVRMNEESIICILDHFRRTDNYNQFGRYVELLQGLHGGLWQARPDILITAASQGRLVRQNRFGKEKIIQKMPPTPGVFQALVEGLLHFDGFNAALELCRNMARAGWGLSMRGLTSLLRDCMERSCWQSGIAVWEQIKAVQARSKKGRHSETIQAGTYATMMKLCVTCGQQDKYEAICKEALFTRKTSPEELITLMRQLSKVDARVQHLRAMSRSPESALTIAEAVSTSTGPYEARELESTTAPVDALDIAVFEKNLTEDQDMEEVSMNDSFEPVDSEQSHPFASLLAGSPEQSPQTEATLAS